MPPSSTFPRMGLWLLAYVALFIAAKVVQQVWPGSLDAVTLYKAHLLALGGWGGYWLDRALFPYDRPHAHLAKSADPFGASEGLTQLQLLAQLVAVLAFVLSMLRRAIVVAACLVCVGLGA